MSDPASFDVILSEADVQKSVDELADRLATPDSQGNEPAGTGWPSSVVFRNRHGHALATWVKPDVEVISQKTDIVAQRRIQAFPPSIMHCTSQVFV